MNFRQSPHVFALMQVSPGIDHVRHYQIFAGAGHFKLLKVCHISKNNTPQKCNNCFPSQNPQPGNEVVLVSFLSRVFRFSKNMGKTTDSRLGA